MAHKVSSEPRRQRVHNASDFDLSIVWVLLRFSRPCVCACELTCVCVHVRLTGKGVAGRDWRQNTGNATTTMAAWIGRNGVYDNRKGIERGRNSISLSFSLSSALTMGFRRFPFLWPLCLILDPSWTRRSEIASLETVGRSLMLACAQCVTEFYPYRVLASPSFLPFASTSSHPLLP